MGRVLAWPAVLLAAAAALISAAPSASAATARTPAVADVEIFSAHYTIAPAGWSYTIFDVTLLNRGPDPSAGVVLRLNGLDSSLRDGWGYGFPDTCQFDAGGAQCRFETSLGTTTFKVPVCTSDRAVDLTVTTSSTDPDPSNNVMHARGVTAEESVGLSLCPAYAPTPTPTPAPSPVRTDTSSAPGNPGGGGGPSGGGGSGNPGTDPAQPPGTTPMPPPGGEVAGASGPAAPTSGETAGAATGSGSVSSTAKRSKGGGGSGGWLLAGVGGAITIAAALFGWQRWRRRPT
jgi:hypothetical protein